MRLSVLELKLVCVADIQSHGCHHASDNALRQQACFEDTLREYLQSCSSLGRDSLQHARACSARADDHASDLEALHMIQGHAEEGNFVSS